jgi:D-3-phosphoglycerate dehydrogenase
MRIVLCYPVESRHIEQIAAAVPEAEIVDAGQERVATEIFQADVFCGHPKVPMDWEGVVRQGRLRWIQSSAAGLDHVLVPPIVASDILVTSASGVLADQVAEHALGLLIGLLRGMPVFFRAQQAREFIRRPTRDLHHSTVGIVGFGGVGRRIAEVLRPFKTRILATDVFPIDKPSYVEQLLPADALSEMLPLLDILMLAAPLTARTRGVIDKHALARLRPGSILINVARGPLVVEADLVATLESGHLFGAAVDVTEIEPLPATSRLWELPNVLITPHVGGQSARRIDQMTDFFCDNLQRYKRGAALRNVVDKQLGFPIRKLLKEGGESTPDDELPGSLA